ncbi:ABC transporter permease [Lipingzhangella sp. LS1_29]|uniref:Transport permease protein n=1 Tax=Lipingzhangella rawalii TaxID=2055835 RepID=A0ABU2H0I5_9ACTN|nr:ABC transporter permease [Lipingzhangella rawalii]MDS1268814.1 ABC transporter permease [Lipingzhangella rawalii]
MRPTGPARLTPAALVRHGLLLTWRSLLKIKRNPEEILGLTFMPIMFVALFVFVFGQAMMGDWQVYRDFLMPGIIAQSVIFTTIGTGITLNTDIQKGIFDRFRSLPVTRSSPLVGAVLGDLVRYFLTVVVILAVGMAIGFRPGNGLVGVLASTAVIMVFAFALCWISAWIGLVMRTQMAVQNFGMIWMFPLSFGSSAFVDPNDMPGWMAAFAEINPVTHVVDTMRGLLVGGDAPVTEPLLWTLGWTVVITAVFFPLAARAYRNRS